MRVEDDEKGPERTCVATRAVRPVGELLRFAVGPDEVLTPDVKGKLPGRGVWVTCSRHVLEEAVRRKAFARSLKRPVVVPDGLADLVERLLAQDARQFLALANKAGLVIAGFAKVEAALASGRVAALVSAGDAGEDGRRKLRQAAHRHASGAGGPPMLTPFAGSEMDLALGRENAIHAALLAGPATDAFLARCARLERFRAGEPRGTRPDAGDDSASTGPFALEND
jgi:predicted RNA-binding protein YlxR (DUF448 family)